MWEMTGCFGEINDILHLPLDHQMFDSDWQLHSILQSHVLWPLKYCICKQSQKQMSNL